MIKASATLEVPWGFVCGYPTNRGTLQSAVFAITFVLWLEDIRFKLLPTSSAVPLEALNPSSHSVVTYSFRGSIWRGSLQPIVGCHIDGPRASHCRCVSKVWEWRDLAVHTVQARLHSRGGEPTLVCLSLARQIPTRKSQERGEHLSER